MEFFLEMNPPTATAQEKTVRIAGGKPVYYDPAPVKAAKKLLTEHLAAYCPEEPLTGPLELRVVWFFPHGRAHRSGEWRATRPDTDNLQKLLRDCMTRCGYWRDDAQVVRELVEKCWADDPTGIYIEVRALEPYSADVSGRYRSCGLADGLPDAPEVLQEDSEDMK